MMTSAGTRTAAPTNATGVRADRDERRERHEPADEGDPEGIEIGRRQVAGISVEKSATRATPSPGAAA